MTLEHRAVLLLTTAIAGGLSPVAARAQVADQATTQPADSNNTAAPSAANAPGMTPPQASGIEDIVVTAQRTNQSLQRVPISVSAVTAAMAENMGIRGSQDLTVAAPALNFAETGSGANITIRGVGGSGSTVDESANALYIDGVYQAASPGLIFNFNNIERIEVAKGPQGTLFGRNSTGGVIQIITRDPQETLGGDVSLGYGNYKTDTEQLYLTGGLAKGVAADIAVYREVMGDGWGRNVHDGTDAYRGRSLSLRSKLKFDFDPDTSLLLSGSYSKTYPSGGQGGSILPGELTTGTPNTGNVGFFNLNYDAPFRKEVKQYQVAATLKHDFGWARLVDIASYSGTTLFLTQDRDLGPAPTVQVDIRYPVETATEELQLLSPTGSKVTWAAGLYYFHNRTSLDPLIYSGPSVVAKTFPTQAINAAASTASYSGYAQATVPIVDTLRATVGLRYSVDDRSFYATQFNSVGTVQSFSGDKTDRKLTKRAALDWQVASTVLVYASYTTGFHSGLFNIASPSQPAVDPENVEAIEGGFKSDLFNRAVRLNVSAFHYNFTGIQIRALNNLGAVLLINASSAKVNGVDADLTIAPTRNLRLTGALSYLDSHYGSFAGAPFYRVPASGIALQQYSGDASGNRTAFSPRWVFTAGADYKIGPANLFVTDVYNDGYFFDPQNRVSSGSYNLVNAGVDVSLTQALSVRVYGRNLFDRRYYASIATSTLGDEYYPGAPRTYGAAVRYKF